MTVLCTSKLDLRVKGAEVSAFVIQPDDDANHPGIVLIQEWWGLEPHILNIAQKLATEGFVVAVPDLYHGKIATEPNEAMPLMMGLRNNLDRVVDEIAATLEAVKGLPNVQSKKLGLIGFCIGGFLTYTVAARYPDLAAVVSLYGSSYDPTPEEVAKVNAPVLAIYGRQDQSIPLDQVEKIEQLYKEAGKDFTVKLYDAGHAFVNPTHGMGNEKAAADAWLLAVSFLKEKVR
jgi:carboxymethylenebutenolidase